MSRFVHRAGFAALLLPSVAYATETNAGFFVIGVLLCIPSVAVFSICLCLIWLHAKRPRQNFWFVALAPLVMIPFGVTFTRFGVPIPLWAVAQDGRLWEANLWAPAAAIAFLYFVHAIRRWDVLQSD